ncbi:MAG: hypothetical protein ACKORJ_09955 [Bacteroidota bacterium]
MRRNFTALFIYSALFITGGAFAQTATDGLMMPGKNFCSGFITTQDSWDHYWEGSLKRVNGNVGTVSTSSIAWMGNYGISDRFNAIAMLPWVATNATGGTLKPMQGLQDLSLTLKYQLKEFRPDSLTKLKLFVVGHGSTPVSNYTPDYLPLSIGLGSTQGGGRITLFAERSNWYLVTSAGYTFRGNVTLDRQSYYTDGALYLTNKVAMPQVFDMVTGIGRINNGLETKINWYHQRTLGGGDIRRQDMPFVSNRMNSSRVELLAMYYLPKSRRLALRASVSRTIAGRNVGESTTVLGGILYTFKF